MKQLISKELKRQREDKIAFDRKWDIVDKKLKKILFMILWLRMEYRELRIKQFLLFESCRQLEGRVSALEKRVFTS